jgi:hypothetical protein
MFKLIYLVGQLTYLLALLSATEPLLQIKWIICAGFLVLSAIFLQGVEAMK